MDYVESSNLINGGRKLPSNQEAWYAGKSYVEIADLNNNKKPCGLKISALLHELCQELSQ